MSFKQDRQGARTPADLERKYNYEKKFSEISGAAADARLAADEAKKIAAGVSETARGLALQVKDLEDGIVGSMALEIVENGDGTKYSQLRSDVDKAVFNADNFEIDSDLLRVKNGVITSSREHRSSDPSIDALYKDTAIMMQGYIKVQTETWEGETQIQNSSVSLSVGRIQLRDSLYFRLGGRSCVPLIEVADERGNEYVVCITVDENGKGELYLHNGPLFSGATTQTEGSD